MQVIRIKRDYLKLLAVVLVAVCLFGITGTMTSHAALTVDVSLFVRQNVESNIGNVATREFTYRVTPADPAYPMPAGTVAGEYTFTLTGNTAVNTTPITFTQAHIGGTFIYNVSTVVTNRDGVTYDTQVFEVEIRVRTIDGQPGIIMLVRCAEDNEEKPEEMQFNHTYLVETVTLSGTKTWDHGTNAVANRPTSATVHLYENGVRVETFVVNAANNWTWSTTRPAYDAYGNRLTFTIVVENIANYTTAVSGLNAHSVFIETPVVPPTGEDNSILIGSVIAGISLIGIFLVAFKRRNNEAEEV